MKKPLLLPKVPMPSEPIGLVRDRAQSRAKWLGALMLLWLTAILVRGVMLCVDPNEEVVAIGASKRFVEVRDRAARGSILDREGRPLAISVESPEVSVDPFYLVDLVATRVLGSVRKHRDKVPMVDLENRFGRELETERRTTAAQLSAALGDVSAEQVYERISKCSRTLQQVESLKKNMQEGELPACSHYEKIAGPVHPKIAEEIRRFQNAGIKVEGLPRRYYPEGVLASQLVGFIDVNGSGQAGLELSLNEDLLGRDVVGQRTRDKEGLDIKRPATTGGDANRGLDVYTTIDRQIQRAAERSLEGIIERSAPLSASVVVVRVKSGDILAMANVPSFNPNAITEDTESRKNHTVVDGIEPGSTLKAFTFAAAVDQDIFHKDDKIDCECGAWAVGGKVIHDDHPHCMVTVGEALKYSSNICTAKIGFKVGASAVIDYLHRFGFESQTGVSLPGERSGFIRAPETIRAIEFANTTFGQGVTVTPLQLAMAYAAIANDGIRMKARLVTRKVDALGTSEFIQDPEVAQRVISAAAAEEINVMLQMVTEEGGTGFKVRVPGYRVAGKTGTAQKVKVGRKGYSDERISSFVGYLPADHPEVVIAVIVDEPTIGSRYGGTVAGPAFVEVAKATMGHLGIAPDPALLDPVKGKKVASLIAREHSASEAGRGAGGAVAADSELTLAWLGDAWSVPDLRGRSQRDVVASFQGTGLKLEIQGSGRVIGQSPEAGELIPLGALLRVMLQ